MNLDVKDWKYFVIGDFFTFSRGKTLSLEDKNSYAGDIPCINGSAENNGVLCGLSSGIEEIGFKKQSAPALSLSRVGASGMTFVQPRDFYIADNAFALHLKSEQNEYVYLFLSTILNKETIKYSYGRTISIEKYLKTKIKLPATSDGSPDWDFMERFIISLHHKTITTKITKKPASPDTSKWRRFRFGDMISSIYKAKAYNDEYLTNARAGFVDSVPYITRTDENNGVKSFVLKQELNGVEGGNAIVIGDTTATVSYQEKDFICGDHIVVVRADWLNKFTGLFIVTLLRKENYRYSYGRAFKMEAIKDTFLKIPATADGSPDYKFMEEFIKSLSYSDRI